MPKRVSAYPVAGIHPLDRCARHPVPLFNYSAVTFTHGGQCQQYVA